MKRILPILPILALGASALVGGCFSEGGGTAPSDRFPTSTEDLDFAQAPVTHDPADGDTLVLTAAPVKKVLKGVEVRMLGYNGSIPGPTIRVKQGSRLTVRVVNRSGLPGSLHSHGVRMPYQFDGAPVTAAAAIPDGGSYDYALTFPDAGLFWYHPHFRSDYALEMGLYGNFVVLPENDTLWRPVDREQMLMVDDFFMDPDRKTSSFQRKDIDRNMMGRFGNLYLLNGDTAFSMSVKRKERVRFLVTNSCNTRAVNLEFRDPGGAVRKLKIIGSDNGPYEWYDTASSSLVSPSERKILDMHFDKAGTWRLVNHMLKSAYTQDSTDALGTITVLEDSATTGYGDAFLADEGNPAARASIDSVRAYASPDSAPVKRLLLTGVMSMAARKISAQPEPISIEAKGVEWYDHMPEMNEISNPSNMRWVIRDLETGKENHEIDWTFKRGQKVKIRIINDTAATHPMPHPFHVHGQRFLVVGVNGRRNLNMGWKDTYLVGTKETTDILLDASNPGEWMAHCHIAEHHESMMMFHFTVE